LRSIFPLFIGRYESLYFRNTHSYSLKSLTMEILFPKKSLLKFSLSVFIFNFEILLVILFTSSMERIVYREFHTCSGKGKTFFFFQSFQNLQNEIFWNNRRECSDVRFQLQSQINLHGHFVKDVLSNKRQRIKLNLGKVKSDYSRFV